MVKPMLACPKSRIPPKLTFTQAVELLAARAAQGGRARKRPRGAVPRKPRAVTSLQKSSGKEGGCEESRDQESTKEAAAKKREKLNGKVVCGRGGLLLLWSPVGWSAFVYRPKFIG